MSEFFPEIYIVVFLYYRLFCLIKGFLIFEYSPDNKLLKERCSQDFILKIICRLIHNPCFY